MNTSEILDTLAYKYGQVLVDVSRHGHRHVRYNKYTVSFIDISQGTSEEFISRHSLQEALEDALEWVIVRNRAGGEE